MVAAKLFALKFGHRAVKTFVGCYGLSSDFIVFNQARVRSKAQSEFCFFAWCVVVIKLLNSQFNFATYT